MFSDSTEETTALGCGDVRRCITLSKNISITCDLEHRYLKLMRRKLFADAFPKTIDVSPLPVTWPSVSSSSISKTLSYLKNAKRPVIVIGSQALIRGPEYVFLSFTYSRGTHTDNKTDTPQNSPTRSTRSELRAFWEVWHEVYFLLPRPHYT